MRPFRHAASLLLLLTAPPVLAGAAWYQRDIEIPADWQGKRITLLLERTKHTRVWTGRTPVGTQDSLSAPHIFDLTRALSPGRHTLTVLVDNSKCRRPATAFRCTTTRCVKPI